MEKIVITIITILIALGVVYVGYNVYINHQDDIFTTLAEYDSYTTNDKQNQIKIMKYNSVAGGEEKYSFKIYLTNKDGEEPVFIANCSTSAYGTTIDFTEDIKAQDNIVTVTISSNSGVDIIKVDTVEKIEQGQKVRGVF